VLGIEEVRRGIKLLENTSGAVFAIVGGTSATALGIEEV